MHPTRDNNNLRYQRHVIALRYNATSVATAGIAAGILRYTAHNISALI